MSTSEWQKFADKIDLTVKKKIKNKEGFIAWLKEEPIESYEKVNAK